MKEWFSIEYLAEKFINLLVFHKKVCFAYHNDVDDNNEERTPSEPNQIVEEAGNGRADEVTEGEGRGPQPRHQTIRHDAIRKPERPKQSM